jgi:N-acetyl-anhydromuramyl-L-alanine amidase AmpD
MASIPENMRHLPVYITETDQGGPWLDVDSGWVRQAYAEIDAWNQQPNNQQIRALALFRWPKLDRWSISGKTGVMEDFRKALREDYRWQGSGVEIDLRKQSVRYGQEIPVQKPAKPKTPPHRAEWLDDRFPARLPAGQVVTVPITVKNNGTEPWTPGGDHPFRMCYRYYRNRRQLALGVEKELKTELPQPVAPGEAVTVPLRVALPDQAGNYTFEVDLVQEGVASLKELGSPVLTRWLTVEAPRPALPLDGPEGNTLPVPLFADMTVALPRAGTPYARRGLNQIRLIVISHTGANPRVSLQRIAETHIQHGYPGIVYDFVVDCDGQVFKVSNLEEVAQPDQKWSEQGVNVCLAGNFTALPPPLAQLDATGRLCAWLAQNLGLAPDSIVGLGELSKSESPGESFYRGASWKQILSRQVRLHLAAFRGAGETNKVHELQATVDDLRGANRALISQLKLADDERIRLDAANLRLQAELAELQQQLESQTAQMAGGVRVYKWIDRLPRDAGRYRPRRAQDVQYIVIHHTGAPPSTPLHDLAAAHRLEWPGLLFDFVVDEQGEIYQTQPLDQVVETDEPYLANALGIAFAGDFTDQTPNDEQLNTGGQLIAWLLERYPQLRIEHMKGVREFTDHPSPGEQWETGQVWKEMLLAAVRRALTGARGHDEPSEVESQLRSQLADLEHEAQVAQRASQLAQEQKTRLQNELQRLQGQLAERQQDSKAYVIPQPAMRVVVEQLPKHPTLRYERRPLSQISHLAIHHTATPPTVNPTRIAELHLAPDASRGKEAWPAIGYHYFVYADGSIDQTNYLETASYHVHRHNMYSVGIVFAGSFMNGKIPTSAQLRAGAHLVAWLMQDLNIPLARVWGHREFPDNTTVCPGSEWTLGNRWRDLLFERIEQIQAGVGVKNIRHYMLFWHRPFPGPLARQDFVNAINYIGRFRPTLGFSVQDARNAEYVTIVGNEAGISGAEEKSLRNSGCRVERIAGRDEEETSRMLAELANLGRRFRSFDVDF